ncbi:hypothetical protein OO014_04745 [Intrasporangium calvum]|uniref:Peptidase M16 domain protein n=1 Tax=Intrasporangium calvum TaxID=53358 RepID=A0ABT5GEN4_9MICO|nr:hypothetical protein [Intrasporangium calvum]MDC5696557.1 hypothetical protein [Intrasporangium calvum]
MELHDEVRDGLRVFSVSAPRETMRATLFFRVGQADETLATSGWTHLLEHSALHGWSDPRLSFNAAVGLYETRFDFDGEREAVFEHLLKLTRWLAEPDLSGIEHEAKVLRAESEQRPIGTGASNLEWRYGAQGPGLTAYRELGLSRVSAEGLRAWAARMFVAHNAVLATDQRLPDDFAPGLGAGEWHRPVLPEAVASTLPGLHWVHSGLVASGAVTRGFGAGLAPEVIRRTLNESLRQGHGVAYGPWADLERVTRDTAILLCGSDISSEGRETCGPEFIAALSRLAEEGPPQSMLDDLRITRERQLRDPAIAPGIAWSAAASLMTESEFYTFEESHELSSAVTPQEIAAVMAEVQSSLVLGLPQGAEAVPGIELLRNRTSFVAEGATRYPHHTAQASLLLSEDALQHSAEGQLTTVWFNGVAGLLEYPDGARLVISRDGWSIAVEPNAYRKGAAVVAAIDARVPAELKLPQPERDPAHITQPIGALGRLGHRLRLSGRAAVQWFRGLSGGQQFVAAVTVPIAVLSVLNGRFLFIIVLIAAVLIGRHRNSTP